MKPYSHRLRKFARELRQNMTYSEVKLWKKLRNYSMMGYDFHRQKPLSNYIADFYCRDLNLVIEIDGITHEDESAVRRDKAKDKCFEHLGLHTMRFSALQVVHDIKTVIGVIVNYVEEYELKNGVNERVLKRRIDL